MNIKKDENGIYYILDYLLHVIIGQKLLSFLSLKKMKMKQLLISFVK